jgi:hypothetical protein
MQQIAKISFDFNELRNASVMHHGISLVFEGMTVLIVHYYILEMIPSIRCGSNMTTYYRCLDEFTDVPEIAIRPSRCG